VKFWLLTQPRSQVRKLAMLEDYFEEEEEEEEEEQQQQPASAGVAITNNGKRNQPNCSAIFVLLCSAIFVLLTAKERAQCDRFDVGPCVVPYFVEYHTQVNL